MHQFPDLLLLCVAPREHLPSRRCPPDCLLQTGSRQVPSTRCRISGIPLHTLRGFFLPRSPAGYADALPIRRRQRGLSRRETRRRRSPVSHFPPYPPAKPFAREYLSATPACLARLPRPKVRHTDCRTPSKCRSPDRVSLPPFLSEASPPASAILRASCWHSPAGNTPKSNTDIRWSSRPESPAPAPGLFRSRRCR